MRKEFFVCLFISGPVDAVYFRIVELVQYLAPCVMEDVFAFFCRTIRKFGFECDRFRFAVLDLNLFQLASRNEENVFAFLVGKHRSATDAFDQQLGGVLLEVVLPQVVAAFECGAIVQLVAFRSQDGVT